MGDTGEGSKGVPLRITCTVVNGSLFRTAANHISSISSFGASFPYLFVKQMCQIGNMEGFNRVGNYTCVAEYGGRWGYWKLDQCGIDGHGGFGIRCGDIHVRRVIGGVHGIGWGHGIVGWDGFARCRLLATASAGGRGSVGVGKTASEMG